MGMIHIDMEMPDCCDECDICYDGCYCPVARKPLDFELSDKIRMPFCPLTDIDFSIPTYVQETRMVHGKWIDKPNSQWPAYDIRYCSICNWNIHKSKLRAKDNWRFCPNCGAKMDFEE